MKKLIIVCEERLRRYGDFLAQLISGIDDKEDGLAGNIKLWKHTSRTEEARQE